MSILDIAAVLITPSALFGYLNYRDVRLPSVIGLMLIALCLSLVLIALGKVGFGDIGQTAESFIRSIDFHKTLMHGMLSFLLFAGALHVNLRDLAAQKLIVGSLATIGTVSSTFIVGTQFWFLTRALGVDIAFT